MSLWGGQNGRVIVCCVCEVTGRSSVRLLTEVEGSCIAGGAGCVLQLLVIYTMNYITYDVLLVLRKNFSHRMSALC